jgi:hypothetical protein
VQAFGRLRRKHHDFGRLRERRTGLTVGSRNCAATSARPAPNWQYWYLTPCLKEVDTFGYIAGVWVTDFRFVIPIAIALRQSLIEIAAVRMAQAGHTTKMELVYQYLTGPKFRHRVEAIVEKFSDMQADLDRERKAMRRLWAKREAQIQGVIESTVGMYGDLQGIAGRALQEIEGLEIPLLGGETEVRN